MEIFFTDHLRKKMQERRLSIAKVEKTVRHPSVTLSSYNGREERYRKFGKNYLLVIVKQGMNELIVITAHWVERLPKQ